MKLLSKVVRFSFSLYCKSNFKHLISYVFQINCANDTYLGEKREQGKVLGQKYDYLEFKTKR